MSALKKTKQVKRVEKEESSEEDEAVVEDVVSSDDDLETTGDGQFFASTLKSILEDDVVDSDTVLTKRKTKEMKEIEQQKKQARDTKVNRQQRKRSREDGLLRPELAAPSIERKLRKVATKGVVVLFNAIQKHQNGSKSVEEPVTTQVKDLPKEKFLDILKKGKAKPAGWNIMKDDFMIGANMKDMEHEQSSDGESDVEFEEVSE